MCGAHFKFSRVSTQFLPLKPLLILLVSPELPLCKEWMINNIVVPVASGYGLAEDYKYLSKSIKEFSTGGLSLSLFTRQLLLFFVFVFL